MARVRLPHQPEFLYGTLGHWHKSPGPSLSEPQRAQAQVQILIPIIVL